MRVTKTKGYLTKEGSERSRILPSDTLIISNSGATLGVAKILEIKSCANDGIAALIDQHSGDKEFLCYYINTQTDRLREVVATGNGQPNLNTKLIREIPVPFPSEREQRAIAGALSDVDGLITTLGGLIAKKQAIKQGMLQQLLSGKTRLRGFGKGIGFQETDTGLIPADWHMQELRNVSTMHGRIGWQGLKQSEFTSSPSDPYLITGMNFNDDEIAWDEVYHVSRQRYDLAPEIQLRSNDVLMTKDGTIGKLLYVGQIPSPGLATLNSHLLVFRPIENSFVPRYLYYQLSSRRFLEHIELNKSGSTFFGISQSAMGKFKIVLPPIDEQAAIAEALSDMDAEISALKRRRNKAIAIKVGMLQELLTGRTRLPVKEVVL
jgi:type I restriction enzyme S subunit